MSQNGEVIRRGYEAWNQNDMEGALRDVDPEIEWRPRQGTAGVRATPYRGHQGVLAYRYEIEEALGAVEVDVLSTEDFADHVLAHIRARGRGSAIGFATCEQRDQALEVSGVREQPGDDEARESPNQICD
jgi:ketosteroid isomerase-like protein